MIPEELLIFAGRGEYPIYALEGARAAGVKRIVVAGVRGMASKKLLKMADQSVVFGVGELQSALDWLSASGIQQMMLVGQITPMALFRTRFDAFTRQLLASLPIKNAHTIFGKIIEEIEKRHVTVIPSSCFMGDHIPGAGLLTNRPLTALEQDDIDFGHRAAMGVCDLDIGQTILVKEGMVLAVEAFEGTNATLRRGAKLGGQGSVMIKVAKRDHDMRFDIPVFGEHTVKLCKKCGIRAVAFQAGRLVMIDRARVIDLANRYGIALIGLDSGLPMAPLEP
ncbi:MAG: UDP-2,3-diacylglucosamine diphosphatase LpxI [Kiritimatiellae bacterium]|nr:UDP-2,3-diacylglucosamine diphosphatase LpxI [Kiritimatiellia bacterium]